MKIKKEKKYFGIHQPYNGSCSNETIPRCEICYRACYRRWFYYDFDTEHRFTPEDLEEIEKEMVKIAQEGYAMERFVMPRDKALEYFKEK